MVRIRCLIAPDFSLFKAFHHAPRPIKLKALWYRRIWEIFNLWSSGPHGKWNTNTQRNMIDFLLSYFQNKIEINWWIFFRKLFLSKFNRHSAFLVWYQLCRICSWSKTALVSYECVHFPKKVLPSPWMGNFSLNIWWDVKSSTWPLLHFPEFEFLFW